MGGMWTVMAAGATIQRCIAQVTKLSLYGNRTALIHRKTEQTHPSFDL